jgi:hypothetical protein
LNAIACVHVDTIASCARANCYVTAGRTLEHSERMHWLGTHREYSADAVQNTSTLANRRAFLCVQGRMFDVMLVALHHSVGTASQRYVLQLQALVIESACVT